MTKQEMLSNMCLLELGQADVKAIGQSRGFETETLTSKALLQHVFLSEQGVRPVLTSLTERENLGLHLLNHRGEPVELEFFQTVYPNSVTASLWTTHTVRFKGLLQQVKANLIRRGILLFCALYQGLEKTSVSERLRFCFPEEFSPFLPAPFQPRRLAEGMCGQYRKEVVQDKLAEIIELEHAPANQPVEKQEARWRLANGQLLFGGKPFSVERFTAWPVSQLNAAFPGADKEEGFRPVPLLLYALSRLGTDEWLAPDDLLPLWKMALPDAKVPEPRSVCDAGFNCGLLEMAVQDGTTFYRRHERLGAADSAPEDFLSIHNSQEIRVNLERVPLEALERLSEVSRFNVAEGSLRAAPNVLKISHAPATILESPIFRWLREHHPAFRTAVEAIEQKRGKFVVHENLLLAKVNDPTLRVMLEKQFGAPGQLMALSSTFVAFPNGLLPQVQAWMKKSGHVIKTISAHDTY